MKGQDYQLAKRAIEEAAASERGDAKDPKVGAVLIKEGEDATSAHRGQFEKGDHAEFTLLQKILRSKDRTTGATLYTTLEPCTTRSHDKLPCADWIIQKGIRRVVIGILDPNPTICGRGYWKLVDAGIEVELFPPDLAAEVLRLNETFVQSHRGGMPFTSSVAWAIQQKKSTLISPYLGLGWGDALSLQDCPNLREGWPVARVEIRCHTTRRFVLPSRLQDPYRSYMLPHRDDRRFKDNKDPLMLEINPVAFSDSPSLVLDVIATKWGEVQFYRDNIATVAAERNPLIEDLIRGSLRANFPHAFCMHLVVITHDRKILLTKRSPKVGYHPNTWSASVEEQLDVQDLLGGSQTTCEPWAKRFLREELGLGSEAYHLDTFRILPALSYLSTPALSTRFCTRFREQTMSLQSGRSWIAIGRH